MVTGAGELVYAASYGLGLASNSANITKKNILEFREKYLAQLSIRAKNKPFVTDKMPHNFLYIPLICSALPEAKIIHVQRDPMATCWSNYKQYFFKKGLGYSYDLKDVVKYYKIYKELMNQWITFYDTKIYNLDYEKLTAKQEAETRSLINYLGINWEDECLAPHKNKRAIQTASVSQVKQKVYKNSSQAWLKYEPFLNGAFDQLKSITK
jgi:hypothetical protein